QMAAAGLPPVAFHASPEQMLDAHQLDAVMIGTRCSLHTELACRVMAHSPGLPLLVEKPVSTTMPDLLRLKAAYEASPRPVYVSFPLRMTPHVQLVKQIIDSGALGTIEHVQAVNNVTYGRTYFQTWFRDEEETGGLFLQKATHDIDYINYLLGLRPTHVCAMTPKQVFRGDKPAGLYCYACDERETCLESDVNAPMAAHHKAKMCCFAVDTGNEDSGSAIIRYESGMHVAFTQNFFVKGKLHARGARLMGYKGTVEFDFYTNRVTVHHHHSGKIEVHEIKPVRHHFGGDDLLIPNLLDTFAGRAQPECPLDAGLMSALICLKAKESAATDTLQKLEWKE
ncbi:MAG: oxidoreductase, partial [Paenibacillaceae bacterium]|nr:oxidoreductase [Paenibacillaceae bacterium]